MATRPRVLVVDDDPSFVDLVGDTLEHMGLQVLKAFNGIEGLEKAKEEKPDLILLDVMMPGIDGYEICRRLRSDPETKQILILMLTALGQTHELVKGLAIGADDYLPKPYEKDHLEVRVKALLVRRSVSRFSDSRCTLSVAIFRNQIVGIRARGTIALSVMIEVATIIKVDKYSRLGIKAYDSQWRFDSKDSGQRLYQEIFSAHHEIMRTYHHVLGRVAEEDRLHLSFESTRDFLRVPLEFLFDDMNGGEYLVLRHPLSRVFTGVQINRTSISSDFLANLWVNGKRLRILLIGSNTTPDIPGVDQEIETLATSLQTLFDENNIPAEVKTIRTGDATYEVIRRELDRCRYHIVHYAGHGFYDEQSPERSCLYFWENKNRQGELKKMFVTELQGLLKNSDVRFAYLSCCLGTKTGKPEDLLDDDFLGIADGMIHAGVPSVLGFRWPVSDPGAKELALAFYKSLANQGKIDTALLDARCEVAARDRDDITWLSPVLIMQG